MARDKNKPKKQRWYHTLFEAYRITKRSYSWIGWAMLGAALAGLLIGVGLKFAIGSWFWVFFGVMLMFIAPMIVLVRFVRKASYAQIEGMPGAVSAVLDNIGRGWTTKTEPVRFNARSQDMVFRAIGRAGIVLISEGPLNRVAPLVKDETRALKRLAPNAPVHVIHVGNDEGQTPLIKLDRTMKKLPKAITAHEVSALVNRLEAVQTNSMPIPKGIDPRNTRMNRRALRGR